MKKINEKSVVTFSQPLVLLPLELEDARGFAPRAMSTETDELRRLETCAAGSYEIGELVARGGFARYVVRHGRGTSWS